MNNLPILTSTPQPAAKNVTSAAAPAAQSAKLASSVQSGKPVDDDSSEAETFGEVLARQVSDATPADEKLQPTNPVKALKPATAAKSSDDSALIVPALGEALNVQSAEASPVEDTSKPKKALSKTDEIFAHFKAKNNDLKAAPAPTDSNANLPPGALAALVPVSVAATTPADTIAPPKKAALPGSNPNNLSALNLDPVAENPELPAAKATPPLNVALPAGAKNDANFTHMMDTITASTTAKLAGNDDKAAALAAAPLPNANAQATLLTATAPVIAPNVMPVQVSINTPIAHDNWSDEFTQKVTWISNQKEQTAELHLNPPELGPMDVVLKVSGDQATALFTSPHAAVREAVEQAMPKLREMMAESGIMLGNATVSDQAPRGRQSDPENKSSNTRTAMGGISEASRSVNQNVRVSPISRHNGIVDTFA